MRAVGDRIGRYRLDAILGQGGMGVVYRAHDERLGRAVALKVVRPGEHGTDPSLASEAAARLLREARAAAAIEHPNAVAIYDVGEDDGAPFIAMELVEGETLRLKAKGKISWQTKLGWLVDIARALGVAHERGVVHRDVKPENVLVRSDGVVKVLDFGIARRVDRPIDPTGETETPDAHLPSITQEGIAIGTPLYMAPEQLEGKAIDGRADQFAWGVVAYELFAGTSPWTARDGVALIAQILGSAPGPLREAAPDLPERVVRCVERALEKRREDRFASMDELLASLEGSELSRDTTDQKARSRSSATSSPRAVWLALPIVAIAAAIALFSRDDNRGVTTSAASAVAPSADARGRAVLTASDAIFACPILEAKGAPGKEGSLGAAAATLLCNDLALFLGGGDVARTRAPAELLDLPIEPVDDFPDAPYEADGARARSLLAAAKHAVWIDGSESWDGQRHRLRLSLVTGAGPIGAPVEVDGDKLSHAVWRGVDALFGSVSFERRPSSADATKAFGCADLACQRLTLAADDPENAEPDPKTFCAELDRLGSNAFWSTTACVPFAGERAPTAAMGAIVSALFATSTAARSSRAENLARAEQIATLAKAERPGSLTSGLLGLSESYVRFLGGDMGGARGVLDRETRARPRSCAARLLVQNLAGGSSSPMRATNGWCPFIAQGYWARWSTPMADPLPFFRLAYAVSSGSPGVGSMLGWTLLASGKRDEAKLIASRYLDATPRVRFEGEFLFATLDLTTGAPGAALHRLEKALGDAPRLTQSTGGQRVVYVLSDVGDLLGVTPRLMDDFVRARVLADPPGEELPAYYLPLAAACTRASQAVGRACIARVRSLLTSGSSFGSEQGEAYLTGAERLIAGDFSAAVRAWKPIAKQTLYAASLSPDAFDRAGEGELASAIDTTLITTRPGVTMAYVREARRAEKRGDKKRAEELARKFVETYATTDAEVPATAEMKHILARVGVR